MGTRTLLAILAVLLFLVLVTSAKRYNEVEHEKAHAHAERHSGDEKMIDQRFNVREGDLLRIDVGDADVELQPGISEEVHVEIYLEADDLERGRAYFEAQNFELKQSGSSVLIKSSPDDSNFKFRFGGRDGHAHVLIRVTTPERFDVDARTGDGDIRAERLEGAVSLQTSDGDVHAENISGDAISLITSDGDVHLERGLGESINVKTSDGDVMLGDVEAVRISARTSDGDVHIHHLRTDKNADVKTSDGDLRLNSVRAGTFTGRTSDGDVEIDELSAEQSIVQTSDGNIRLGRVEGKLDVKGNDSNIDVALASAADVSIRTSDGNVLLSLPSGLGATLYLRASDVRMASEFAFKGTVEEERAEGTLNGGGPRIEARTSSGSVVLRAR